jgi:O-acetylserine/cysteine efflux transporter
VWSSLFAPLVLIPASLLLEGERAYAILSPSLTLIACVAFLAYAATLFSFASWIRLLGKYGAARVAPFALLIPVFGLGSNMLVLNEKIPPAALLGGILVLFGLFINLFGAKLIELLRRRSV